MIFIYRDGEKFYDMEKITHGEVHELSGITRAFIYFGDFRVEVDTTSYKLIIEYLSAMSKIKWETMQGYKTIVDAQIVGIKGEEGEKSEPPPASEDEKKETKH